MKKWDLASGFLCNNRNGAVIFVKSYLTNLYKKIGVDRFSNANGVFILKECARMMINERSITNVSQA